MVRELTELQGAMGGIYAREEGQPETIWKAIYYHYLPIGVEADAPPSRQQLGAATVTWAAVSLADKLDSVAGMFAGGERPTGSRDPLGLRRQTQGAVKILADLPDVTGVTSRITIGALLAKAAEPWGLSPETKLAIHPFIRERVLYLFEQRGFDVRNVRAVVTDLDRLDVHEARRKLEALTQMGGSGALVGRRVWLRRRQRLCAAWLPR